MDGSILNLSKEKITFSDLISRSDLQLNEFPMKWYLPISQILPGKEIMIIKIKSSVDKVKSRDYCENDMAYT